jgi:hypothetical protein
MKRKLIIVLSIIISLVLSFLNLESIIRKESTANFYDYVNYNLIVQRPSSDQINYYNDKNQNETSIFLPFYSTQNEVLSNGFSSISKIIVLPDFGQVDYTNFSDKRILSSFDYDLESNNEAFIDYRLSKIFNIGLGDEINIPFYDQNFIVSRIYMEDRSADSNNGVVYLAANQKTQKILDNNNYKIAGAFVYANDAISFKNSYKPRGTLIPYEDYYDKENYDSYIAFFENQNYSLDVLDVEIQNRILKNAYSVNIDDFYLIMFCFIVLFFGVILLPVLTLNKDKKTVDFEIKSGNKVNLRKSTIKIYIVEVILMNSLLITFFFISLFSIENSEYLYVYSFIVALLFNATLFLSQTKLLYIVFIKKNG